MRRSIYGFARTCQVRVKEGFLFSQTGKCKELASEGL